MRYPQTIILSGFRDIFQKHNFNFNFNFNSFSQIECIPTIGNLNEQEKNFKKSIKFYKRFFFCARILEDPVGASLGLNRLGVMYHKLKNYQKSLQFHQKHLQFTDNENVFASYYNLGISHRLQRNFNESIGFFRQALEWSQQHQEYESECISNGQLGVTYLIMMMNEQAKTHFESCLRVALSLKNRKLSLDCLLCLGYIAYTSDQYKIAKNYFHKAFSDAQALGDKELAEQLKTIFDIFNFRFQKYNIYLIQ